MDCVNCKERKGHSTLNAHCGWCFDNVFMLNVAKQLGWKLDENNKIVVPIKETISVIADNNDNTDNELRLF